MRKHTVQEKRASLSFPAFVGWPLPAVLPHDAFRSGYFSTDPVKLPYGLTPRQLCDRLPPTGNSDPEGELCNG